MSIGNTISNLRKEKKIKQMDLAKISGISQTYLSQIEKGVKTPTIDILEKISFALGIPYPVLSFLSIDKNDISDDKKEAFSKFEPVISSIIKEIFFSNPTVHIQL